MLGPSEHKTGQKTGPHAWARLRDFFLKARKCVSTQTEHSNGRLVPWGTAVKSLVACALHQITPTGSNMLKFDFERGSLLESSENSQMRL